MVNWIKRLFGLHVHVWSDWLPLYVSDQSIAGNVRTCACGATERDMYPDGH